MASNSAATGVAIFFAYLLHYALYIFTLYGKFDLKKEEIEKRSSKLYLFGFVGILSVYFGSVYAAVFAWFTLVILYINYLSVFKKDSLARRKLYETSKVVYTMFIAFWWIGETATIFANINVPNN